MRADREIDAKFMEQALTLAKQAAEAGEVPVGAVVVKDGKIVGKGRNTREEQKNPLGHAEISALCEAAENLGGWRLCNCTLYVTLEPCPMCAGAIINARVGRVVYGASDDKAGSVGSLINLFAVGYNHTPALTTGVLSEKCGKILSDFFEKKRKID